MTEKDGLTLLSDLRAAEVSLVKRGANLKRRFPIFKRKEEKMDVQEILKTVLNSESEDETKIKDWIAKAALSEGATAAVKAALRALSAYKDELPADALEMLAMAAGYGYPKPAGAGEYPNPADKACGTPGKDKEEEMKKSITAQVQKDFESVMKTQADEVAALKAENEKITKALESEKDKRDLEAWVTKAKTDLSHCPGGSADELGAMLKALADKDKDLAEKQFQIMKATSETIKKSSLLVEAGKNVDGGASTETAMAQIERLAEGLVEKSTDLSMNKAKAMAAVLKSPKGKELYARYLKENPAQIQGGRA